jgi:LysR family cys regulon transcriptional activator
MKLRQLHCLCSVVDAGFNISRAADILHATQPAVGKQIRQLEEDLGVDLLLRQGGRVVALTKAGERTVDWARRALQCAQNIRAVAQENAPEEGGNIVIATSHAHANYVLLPAIVAFARQFPRVRINVLQGSPGQVAELVREGKVAVGVTHLPHELPCDVVTIPFLTSQRVVVTPVGHPLLKERALTLEKLAAYPIIVPNSSRPQGGRIVRKFHEAGLEVNVAVQAIDADVMKTYVTAGLGIGILPAFSYSARQDRGLRMRAAGHLFDPAVSAVLLRRGSHMQQYIYGFLENLDPVLERRRLEALVLEDA